MKASEKHPDGVWMKSHVYDGGTMTELKPCPFCGGAANIGKRTFHEQTVAESEWHQPTFYFVSCKLCTAQTDTMRGCLNEEVAAERWNRRTP